MKNREFLAAEFEHHRGHLRSVAYRLLGSASEADDAVQEAWLRLSRSDADQIQNLRGWLTTVVGRVCLDMLRSRASRREDSLDAVAPASYRFAGEAVDPEEEALLADSIGTAMLVVLDVLTPSERLAFVLHDMFGVPFEEIAPIVGRSASAARQLASRARRRVRGAEPDGSVDIARQREVVEAFLAAARNADFEGLLAVLDPDVVTRADLTALRVGGTGEMRGARTVAEFFLGRAQQAYAALLGDSVGVVVAPGGQMLLILDMTVIDGRIVAIDVIADRDHLAEIQRAGIAA
ncbi:MAG TPA: sigma-70 family RNA polymerase sigma factor [Thermomicrobiales bacterium]|nr:sigma-70 family RNA polymerase sigma factor [Thermomicrobiales bacterium]